MLAELDLDGVRQVLSEPLIRYVAGGALLFILIVVVLYAIGRSRTAAAEARRRAEVRRNYDVLRLREEEIRQLASSIVATSSTSRVAGYSIVRQVEAVFSEGCPSSAAAVDRVKAMAARMDANAIINLQTRQTPNGKWVANGDAVIVRNLSRPKA